MQVCYASLHVRPRSWENLSRRCILRSWNKSAPSPSAGLSSPMLWVRRKWHLEGREQVRRKVQKTLRRGRCTTMQRRPNKWETLSHKRVRREWERATLSQDAREKKKGRLRRLRCKMLHITVLDARWCYANDVTALFGPRWVLYSHAILGTSIFRKFPRHTRPIFLSWCTHLVNVDKKNRWKMYFALN